MNSIEKLPVFVNCNGDSYMMKIYHNAWGNLTISYISIKNNEDYLCSVCVEPKNKEVKLEDTEKYSFNARIGNTKTVDRAVDLILGYIKLSGGICER